MSRSCPGSEAGATSTTPIATAKRKGYSRQPAPGYPEAAEFLLAHGLTPAADIGGLRAMWKAGGPSRRAALVIAERWGLA